MLNLRYERVKARALREGELFATAENPGVWALRDQWRVDVAPPDGALGFGIFHVRTGELITNQQDAEAVVYRVTIEVLPADSAVVAKGEG